MSDIQASALRVGKRGTIVLPARLRRKYGIAEGTTVLAQERDGGIVILPAVTLPVEIYTAERKAEFLLNNAVGWKDYQRAVALVKKLGVDPASVPHEKPARA